MVHIPVQSSEPSDASALPQSQSGSNAVSIRSPQAPHLRQPDHSDSHARHTVHPKNLPEITGSAEITATSSSATAKAAQSSPIPAASSTSGRFRCNCLKMERFNTLFCYFSLFHNLCFMFPYYFRIYLSDLLCCLCRNSCLLCLILCLSLLC